MKNRKLFVVVTLIAIFIWAYNFYTVKERLLPSISEPQGSSVSNASNLPLSDRFTYNDKTRDPFRPKDQPIRAPQTDNQNKVREAPKTDAPPPFAIDGMLWDEKNPSVVLKNIQTGESKMVEKGTVWENIKVIDIKQDRVIIRYGKKDITLQ